MKKFIFIILLILGFTLSSCESGEVVGYEEWKLSEDATDYNGDSKINEVDYGYFVAIGNYENWLLTEDAEDLNEDRKIDELDYEIFLLETSFIYWLLSDYATDYNKDSVVDELDYDVFLNGSEFVGTYKVENYAYFGAEETYISGDDERIYFKDLSTYLVDLLFVVDQQGGVTITLPDATQNTLGESYNVILDALEGMTITRLSTYLSSIDIELLYRDQEVSYSVYLNETDTGFSVDYSFLVNSKQVKIEFDLVKVS